jgi:hypothetical protein
VCYANDVKFTDQQVFVVSCRDVELANLRALLRGAIRKLERCRDAIDEAAEMLS